MDFLNKALGQVSELFGSMTPAARMTTGLLLVVIAISLVFLFQQQTDKADEYLFGARLLTNGEIANMTAAFSNKDLNDWELEGNRIRVPRGQRHKYIAALVEGNALPEDSGAAWEDVFKEQNPFENRVTQELRARIALQKDLAFTIREFVGAESAAVQIQEVSTETFRSRPKRRAAVAVKAGGNRELDPNQVKMIRDLVANGGGVDEENVVITDGHRSYAGPLKDGISAEQNAYVDTQRRIERETKKMIVDHLSFIPGTKVAVYVELDPTLSQSTRDIKYDPKPTPVKISTTSKDSTSTSAANAGRPGAGSNGVGNQPAAVSSTPANEDTLSETTETQESKPSITQTDTRKPGLVPTLISASIFVPKSHFKRVWREENPTPPGEDPREPEPAELQAVEAQQKTAIEEALVPLIKKAPQGEDSFPRVKVVPFVDIPLPVPSAPSTTEIATSWFAANWQTLAMLGVALFGLFFLRGMIQSAQTTAMESAAASQLDVQRAADLDSDDDDEEEETDEFGNSLRGRFNTAGRSLRDELTELVREDPDAAASVLQNWISEAA
jgi:flagellar M-ring protein FliF